jgi:amidase
LRWRRHARTCAPSTPTRQRVSRIGVHPAASWGSAAEASQHALAAASARLDQAGAEVADADPPVWFADLPDAQRTVMAFEAARAFAPERRDHGDRLSPSLRALLDDGDRHSPAEVPPRAAPGVDGPPTAGGAVRAPRPAADPSTPGPAPHRLESTGDPMFNRAWTLLGTPCLHLPTGVAPNGLPVGVQLVGRPGDDTLFLAMAAWAEERLV